jgi:hypothetical protein
LDDGHADDSGLRLLGLVKLVKTRVRIEGGRRGAPGGGNISIAFKYEAVDDVTKREIARNVLPDFRSEHRASQVRGFTRGGATVIFKGQLPPLEIPSGFGAHRSIQVFNSVDNMQKPQGGLILKLDWPSNGKVC